MHRDFRHPSILAALAILLVLLSLLAYLQYQWQGQVSEALKNQLREQMRRAAAQFGEDFDREIIRVYETFRTDTSMPGPPEEQAARLRREYAALYARWNGTAPYPKLVEALFLVPNLNESRPALERLNPATERFEPAGWPAELLDARASSAVSTMKIGSAVKQFIELPSNYIDSKAPAVVLYLIDAHFGSKPAPEAAMPGPLTVAQVIVKLNRDYIQKEFIPALAREHLSNSDGALSYNVAVVERSDPPRIVYSNGGLPDVNAKGDIRTDLFAKPLDFRRVFSLPAGSAEREVRELRDFGKTFSLRIQENRRVTADPAIEAGLHRWQLVLAHRAGSVDAAVSQARNKNLAISFGILLLLALSSGLIIVLAQRERRLAMQQMQFVSAVSHELRTPLAVIRSAGENLADGIIQDSAQTRQYGALVRNEGRRLTEMIEQVLDFAGIQSGLKAYKFEPAEAGDLVDRALQTFEIPIRDNGIVVQKRIASGLPPIAADSSAIVRVLQNLIGNALKYGGGKWLGITAEAAPQGVAIRVEDRGDGVSPADLPHIFEPFYRGRAAIDAQIKGSGLGLSIVKQVVEAHGAAIAVESASPRGAAFTILFPTAAAVTDAIGTHDEAYSPR